jgi:hypothetical protein
MIVDDQDFHITLTSIDFDVIGLLQSVFGHDGPQRFTLLDSILIGGTTAENRSEVSRPPLSNWA